MAEFSITATTDVAVDALTDDQVDTLLDTLVDVAGVLGGRRGRMTVTATIDAADMPDAVREGLVVLERAHAAAVVAGSVVAVEVRTAAEFERDFASSDVPPFAVELVVDRPPHADDHG